MYSYKDYCLLMKNLGKEIPKEKNRSKYNAKKEYEDGIRFDSIKEAEYYRELKFLTKGKAIAGFARQARFVVTCAQDGLRGTEYVCDFIVFHNDGTYEIIDVKGMETEVFKLKMKSFKEKYPKLEIKLMKGI